MGIPNPANYIDATIANAATTSGAINLEGKKLVGIEIPASFTGATVSFTQCRSEGGTYIPVYNDDGSLYSVTATDAAYVRVNPAVFAGCAFIKVVSASSESGEKVVTVVCIDL